MASTKEGYTLYSRLLPVTMHLMYYLDNSGKRVYTLKKETPQGAPSLSAHPARFSPDDKFSKERIACKKRFGILPTQFSPKHPLECAGSAADVLNALAKVVKHTKERRRSGFEEFLRLIISLDPMPPEMKDFLELDDHRDSQPISPSTSTKLEGGGVSTPSRKRPQSVNSVQKAENKGMSTPSTPTQSGSQKPEDYIPFSISTGASAPATPEQAAKQRLEDSRQDARRELRNILLTTFTVSSIVYALCVFTGIVDVTDTSPGRILLTALSLGSTFSLLRISMIKREIRKRERLASTESAEEW